MALSFIQECLLSKGLKSKEAAAVWVGNVFQSPASYKARFAFAAREVAVHKMSARVAVNAQEKSSGPHTERGGLAGMCRAGHVSTPRCEVTGQRSLGGVILGCEEAHILALRERDGGDVEHR